MSNDKLEEALRRTCRKMKTFSRTGALDGAVAVWVDEIESAIAAHAAEAAQIGADPALSVGGCESVDRNKQMQAAEPVYQVDLGDGCNDVDEALFREYERFNKNHPNYYDIRILYTHPQPAQDAKDAARYRWLKKNDNCDLLAEDVIDEAIVAMAKESGR